ncbi:MAG: FAD-dependent oxidoreductase [Candidatus Margulisiibacteriota bacterium]
MKVAVVGGGITGLSLSYYLAKEGHQAELFEKEDHLGGLASTFKIEDARIEKFYHHFFSTDEHLIGLILELGLTRNLIWAKSSMGYYTNGKIHPFTSPFDLLSFSPISIWSRVRLGLLSLSSKKIKDWRPLSKISAKDWLIERIGQEAYSVVWEPLLISKFGSEHNSVPAAWVWARLAARAKTRGIMSEKLGYLRGGLDQLFDSMAEGIRARGGKVRLKSPIEDIDSLNDYDRIIFTMAPPLVSDIIKIGKPTRYAGNICVVLKINDPVSGYYWTNIGDPSITFCAIVEQNNAFDDKRYNGKRIIYLSKYTSHDDRLWGLMDEEIIDLFVKDLNKIKPGINYEAAYVFRNKWAQPLISLNYAAPPFEIEKGRIYMVNNAQIYPRDRGINDSISLAKQFAGRYN